ncbi:MAG: MBL fold metallo-hydrolase [Clostridia bacterium]|nr:MBL fold metallo-hydrolase [Clostridia bacterium]
MNLTVLGRYGPFPQAGDSACSCYYLEDGDLKLLMDMGPGSLRRVFGKVDLSALSALFLSHLHYDHTSDLLPLRYALENKPYRLKILAKKEDTDYCRLLLDAKEFDVTWIDDGEELGLCGKTLRFTAGRHTVPDLAVTVYGEKVFTYTGDTVMCEGIRKLARESDVLLADCAKPSGFMGPHMTADDCKELLELGNARILATHLSPGTEPEEYLPVSERLTVVRELETYVL